MSFDTSASSIWQGGLSATEHDNLTEKELLDSLLSILIQNLDLDKCSVFLLLLDKKDFIVLLVKIGMNIYINQIEKLPENHTHLR